MRFSISPMAFVVLAWVSLKIEGRALQAKKRIVCQGTRKTERMRAVPIQTISVSDPHQFLCGSGSSIFAECGSGSYL
jgi:hypothetical protein